MKKFLPLFALMLAIPVTGQAAQMAAANTVNSAAIIDGQVTTNDIANKAVTAAKIADSTITASQLAAGAVTGAKIATDAVASTAIVDKAITNTKLADGAVSGVKIADGVVTDAKLAVGSVVTAKIADGAVTDAKISGIISTSKLIVGTTAGTVAAGDHTHLIGTEQIADGAVSDAKIAGPIATSKLSVGSTAGTVAAGDHQHDGVYQHKYANVVVVATSGGDYSSIQEAVNAVNPTADAPCLITIMPGVYAEAVAITGKGNFHLQGAGKHTVRLLGGITVTSGTNFEISDLSFSPSASPANSITLNNCNTFTVHDTTMTGTVTNGSTDWISGIAVTSSTNGLIYRNAITYFTNGLNLTNSTVTIEDNTITGDNTYFHHTYGINTSGGSYKISRNTVSNMYQSAILFSGSEGVVTGNSLSRAGYGVQGGRNTTLVGNVITSCSVGILLHNGEVSGVTPARSRVTQNTITGCTAGMYFWNGASPLVNYNTVINSGNQDVYVAGDSTPVLISNTYNSIVQSTAAGRFNADANGNPVLP